MQAESLAEFVGVQWSGLAERAEDFQFDSAQQRLRRPEPEPQLHDPAGVKAAVCSAVDGVVGPLI